MTYAPVIPLENVRLRQVTAAGFSEDSGRPATAGAVRWSGDQGAYLFEEVELERSGEEVVSEVREARMRIPTSLGIDVRSGDTVTYDRGAASVTRTVRDVRRFDVVGVLLIRLWDA